MRGIRGRITKATCNLHNQLEPAQYWPDCVLRFRYTIN